MEHDTVVVFLSPSYKARIERNDGLTGDAREYFYIKEILKNTNKKVIPVIIAGSIRESVPKELSDIIAVDFSQKKPMIIENGRSKVNPNCRKDIKQLCTAIIYETELSYRRKNYEFSSTDEAYEILFCNTYSQKKLPKECMYKTEAYKSIMSSEGSSFLVGRKGSGKTTFFEILEKYNSCEYDKRFKVLRPISVEDIREENLYETFTSIPLSDKSLFGYPIIIELFWEIYFHLCAIYIVCIEEENHQILDRRKTIVQKISAKLKRDLNVTYLDNLDVKKALFTLSLELWNNFVKEKIVHYGSDKVLLASFDANFNVNNVLLMFFGDDYRLLIKAIEECDKKILIALDKFDTLSDDFRRTTKMLFLVKDENTINLAKSRFDFDVLLYRSLITAVEKLKKISSGIMGKSEFCIIIPQDRIEQIRIIDRDFTKRNFIYLSWDAIELLQLIIIRFKALQKFDVSDQINYAKQFDILIEKCFPSIPKEIPIEVGGQKKEVGLYQYILRLSFWRPRDIIKYFAVFYDAHRKNISNREIDLTTIKQLINNVTDEILKSEFYNEVDKVIYNIEDIINLFKNKNIILSTHEFIETINNIEFEGTNLNGNWANENEVWPKIFILYELGVIGLKISKDTAQKMNIGTTQPFIFNEGLSPIKKMENKILQCSKEVEIVLNPIFSNSLLLTNNTNEIIGDYSWNYLENNHIIKKSIVSM